MAVVPGTSQGGVISIDDVLKNTSADDILLETGAKYLIDNNIKVFNHSIHTISKFSDQLHLEPSVDGLSLKALNSSKSAFASILFTRQFFGECDVAKIDTQTNNLCRISMRSALSIFGRAGVQAADRMQLSCKLQVDPSADYLIVQMAYTHFVTKCYVIPFRDCVVTYKHLFNDKAKLRNRLTLQAKTLLTVLTQIGSDLDEVKIVATPDRFSIERFFTTDEDRIRVRKTEATIDLDAFERYYLQHTSEVALNLKEFKAVLSFADVTGMSVNLHFDQPGRPIIVALEENVDFVAEFVLATFEVGGFRERTCTQMQQTTSSTNAQQPQENAAEVSIRRQQNDEQVQEDYWLLQQDQFEQQQEVVQKSQMQPPTTSTEVSKVKQPNRESQKQEQNSQRISKATTQLNDRSNNLADINPVDCNLQRIATNFEQHQTFDASISAPIIMHTEASNQLLAKNDERGLHADEALSQALNAVAVTSKVNASEVSSSSSWRESREVVIDEDHGFDFSSWNSKQKSNTFSDEKGATGFNDDLSEASKLQTFNGIEGNNGVVKETNVNSAFEPLANSSPIYDCTNLSCSPSVYLDGQRIFNIRLSEGELERLHQFNGELPSQFEHESGPSTSFVGRLLQVATEKTRPHDTSRRESLTVDNFMSTWRPANEISTRKKNADNHIENNDNRNGISVESSKENQKGSSAEYADLFSPNSADLDRLENAVQLLQNRFGGFKERPNTQQFSQARAALIEENPFNLLHETFSHGISTLDSTLPNSYREQSDEQPLQQRSLSQTSNCAVLSDSKLNNDVHADENIQKASLDEKRSHVLFKSSRSTTATTNKRTNKVSTAVNLDRPLDEIEREFQSDSSMDQPLVIDEVLHLPTSSIAQVTNSTSTSVHKKPKPATKTSTSRDSLVTTRESKIRGTTGNNGYFKYYNTSFEEESNDSWLASGRFCHNAALGEKSDYESIAVGQKVAKADLTAVESATTARSSRGIAAAVKPSTSSVCLLEEDYGCDGGWLRKPNTQRNINESSIPFNAKKRVLRSDTKKPTTIYAGSTDDELEGILASVTNFRNTKKATKNFSKKSTDSELNANIVEGRVRKRSSTEATVDLSTTVLRPLRKKLTLADELARRPSPPARISPPAVIVLTSPKKRR